MIVLRNHKDLLTRLMFHTEIKLNSGRVFGFIWLFLYYPSNKTAIIFSGTLKKKNVILSGIKERRKIWYIVPNIQIVSVE